MPIYIPQWWVSVPGIGLLNNIGFCVKWEVTAIPINLQGSAKGTLAIQWFSLRDSEQRRWTHCRWEICFWRLASVSFRLLAWATVLASSVSSCWQRDRRPVICSALCADWARDVISSCSRFSTTTSTIPSKVQWKAYNDSCVLQRRKQARWQ